MLLLSGKGGRTSYVSYLAGIHTQLTLLYSTSSHNFNRWGPFVCKSDLVHSFKQLDLMVTFELNAPFFHRYVGREGRQGKRKTRGREGTMS